MIARCLLLLMALTVLRAESPLPMGPLRLEMKPLDAAVLFRKDPNDVSTFPVTLLDGDRKLKGRVEVMGSSTRGFAKKSMLIKLEKGQTWRGQRRIALGGLQSDGSWMRNWLAWETIRATGMAAPEVAFQQVSINGRHVGLYLQIEWLSAAMFARHGLATGGQFFQPNDYGYCGDFAPRDRSGWAQCWTKLAPADGDITPIMELGRNLAETPIANFHQMLGAQFEVDALLHWLLVNVLTCNGDTYNKNYFLYRNPRDGRWTIVPWDYDLAFGRTFDPFLPRPDCTFNDSFVYYYPPELGPNSPLKEKTLRNPVLRGRFLKRLSHLLGIERDGVDGAFGLWAADALERRIDALRMALLPQVQAEAYPLSLERFHREVDALQHFVRARTLYLRALLLGPEPWWNADAAVWDPLLAPPPPPLPARLEASSTLGPSQNDVSVGAHGWGFLLARLRVPELTSPIQLTAASDLAQVPRELPPGISPEACIRRTWEITLQGAPSELIGDLTLEYLQENSRRNEISPGVDEATLGLWMLDQGRWTPLTARVNTLSNTLRVKNLSLPMGRTLRFIAAGTRRGEPIRR